MAESHIISALTSKRLEIAGILEHHQKEMERLLKEIKALDEAIRIFEPEYKINAIKTKRYQQKSSFFKHGEATRIILDVLRGAGKPLSTNEITKEIMTLNEIDNKHEKALQASILTKLNNQKKAGVIESIVQNTKGNCIWKLTA